MIVPKHPVDDDELLRLASAHPELFIEREPDGSLSVSPPPPYVNGIRAAEAVYQLRLWGGERGYVAGADGGFRLPDTSVRIPDASWISFQRWRSVPDDARESIPAVVPEVVVEIVSPSDSLLSQRRKAERYVEHGALYAVVIDPRTRAAVEFGAPPDGLRLDFDRIIDAGTARPDPRGA